MPALLNSKMRRSLLPPGGSIAAAVVVLTSLLISTGCAETKSVRPISISQPGDDTLNCAQLDQQIYVNQVAAVNFANQAAKVEDNNSAFQVGTIFMGLAALGIDLSKEDQIKYRSLRDRNEYLQYLKGAKKCQA